MKRLGFLQDELVFMIIILAVYSHYTYADEYFGFNPVPDAESVSTATRKNNLTGDCLLDLRHALFPVKRGNFGTALPTASPYLDATGKPTSGLLTGNLAWLGAFDQCHSLPDALYFLLETTAVTQGYLSHNQTEVQLVWGLCGVSSCNETTIANHATDIFKETLQLPWIQIKKAEVHSAVAAPISTGFYTTLWLTVGLLAVCVVSTVLDIYLKYQQQQQTKLVHRLDSQGPHMISQDQRTSDQTPLTPPSGGEAWDRPPDRDILRRALGNEPGFMDFAAACFSIKSNLEKLLHIEDQRKQKHVGSLDGVRVITMWWIILGHTYLATFSTGVIDNPQAVVDLSQTVSWQPIASAYFTVDTFFFLSGFLVAYLLFHHLHEKNGKFPVARYYIHRYLRLTPTMGFIILIWTFLLPSLGAGPLWYRMVRQPTCEQYWWTNLLYILNFYPVSPHNQCIGWTWYLANDMQFYIIAPGIIYVFYRGFKKGLGILLSLLIGCFVVTATLISVYNIDINMTEMVLKGDFVGAETYERIVYGKPYTRIAPYLVGILLAYLMQKEGSIKRSLPKCVVIAAWSLSFFTGVCLVYGLYWTFHGYPLTRAGTVVYGTFSHFLWASCLAWVVYACRHGYGGVVGDFLGWRGWTPLSRLTYSVYMTHALVLFYYSGIIKTTIHLSTYNVALLYGGCLVLAYIGALAVWLMVEVPVQNLEALLSGRHKKSQ